REAPGEGRISAEWRPSSAADATPSPRERGEGTYRLLRELVRDGLLDESTDGKTVTFPQIHLRDALYNAMNDRRRSEMHHRVGQVLEPLFRGGATQLHGQVGYHYTRADEKGKRSHYAGEAAK